MARLEPDAGSSTFYRHFGLLRGLSRNHRLLASMVVDADRVPLELSGLDLFDDSGGGRVLEPEPECL